MESFTRRTTDRQRFSHAQNLVTHLLRKAKAKLYIYIIESAKGNGKKKVWECINKLTGKYYKQNNNILELKFSKFC